MCHQLRMAGEWKSIRKHSHMCLALPAVGRRILGLGIIKEQPSCSYTEVFSAFHLKCSIVSLKKKSVRILKILCNSQLLLKNCVERFLFYCTFSFETWKRCSILMAVIPIRVLELV